MKCLLCAKIGVNPGARGCQVFDRKPEDIYYENANCPHFERADNDQAKRWLNAYVREKEGYIPREDDTPPPGWEQINIKKCGPHWRSVTEETRKRMEGYKKGIF